MALPMVIVFVVTLLIGVPVALCMVLSGIIPLAFFSNFPLTSVGQLLFSSIDSFTMLAVPLFIASGSLMDQGGVSKRLIDFADSLLGWLPGGLAVVTFFASAFFGAISGSSSATVAAIGGIMIPAMVAAGYPFGFACATAVCAGFLGVIIPPSIPMILYGVSVSGVSIGDLFMGGIIPGIILAGGMSVYAVIYGRKHLKSVRTPFQLKRVFVTFYHALWALGMPIIILGGIYSGIFTPSESAAVAVVYGLLVSKFVYHQLDWAKLKNILHQTIKTNCVVQLVVACAKVLAYVMTIEQIPMRVTSWMTSWATEKWEFYAFILVFLLIVGCVMDTAPAIMVLGPIFSTLLPTYGVSPLAFGVVMVVLLAMGMATPPVGLNLFVCCGMQKCKMMDVVNRHLWAYLGFAVIIVIVMMAVPQLVTFIPDLINAA